MLIATLLCLVGALVSVVIFGLGLWSTRRHTAQALPQVADEDLPPISLLKPIKGLEEDLEENLRTYFEQDYPAPLEIVFASSEENDPGIDVARRVAADYPRIATQFVRSDVNFGLNPKVANLAGALEAATHDLVLQSDANTRANPDYLRHLVGETIATGASLSSSMVIGVGEENAFAALENLQLTSLIAPSTCAALHVAGVSCVIGKSMLFRKSELDQFGGIELVRDILCEDFILGRTYQEAGKRVLLSRTTVQNVNRRIDLRTFLARHSRWLKMRVVIHFGSFVADLFANPIAWSLAAFAVSGFDLRVGAIFLGCLVYKMVGDAYFSRALREEPMAAKHLVLGPFKDLLMVFVWVYSAFSRTVTWRGRKLRFVTDSRLIPVGPEPTPDSAPALAPAATRG